MVVERPPHNSACDWLVEKASQVMGRSLSLGRESTLPTESRLSAGLGKAAVTPGNLAGILRACLSVLSNVPEASWWLSPSWSRNAPLRFCSGEPGGAC